MTYPPRITDSAELPAAHVARSIADAAFAFMNHLITNAHEANITVAEYENGLRTVHAWTAVSRAYSAIAANDQ